MNQSNTKKETDQHLQDKLIKIIKWQGRGVVFLFILAVVAFFICPKDIKLPNQEALKSSPEITADKVQYKFSIFQDKNRIKNNQKIVKRPNIQIIGQIYDYGQVYNKFKDFKFIFNGAEVALDSQSGYYRINYTLKKGNNTLETYYIINQQEYNHQQVILNYQE